MNDRRIRSLVVLVVASGAVVGCAPVTGDALAPSSEAPTPTASASPTTAPTTTEPRLFVDPSAYASVYFDEGVDFDSFDRNTHCAIFNDPYVPESNPQAGCAMDAWNYEFPIVPFVDVTAHGNATVVRAADAGYVVAHSDAPYAGQDTDNNPGVKALAAGESIATLGITCEAIDDAIRCTNDSTGHGFQIARESYEVF